MEIRNGLVELVGGEIRQLHLELAEGLARVADQIPIGGRVIGDGGDVVGHAPEILAVNDIGLPVGSVVEMQGHPAGLLGPDVLGDLIDVLHQLHRMPEGIGIDILHQEGLGATVGENEFALVGLVHVAHLDDLAAHIGTLDPEQAADFF